MQRIISGLTDDFVRRFDDTKDSLSTMKILSVSIEIDGVTGPKQRQIKLLDLQSDVGLIQIKFLTSGVEFQSGNILYRLIILRQKF